MIAKDAVLVRLKHVLVLPNILVGTAQSISTEMMSIPGYQINLPKYGRKVASTRMTH